MHNLEAVVSVVSKRENITTTCFSDNLIHWFFPAENNSWVHILIHFVPRPGPFRLPLWVVFYSASPAAASPSAPTRLRRRTRPRTPGTRASRPSHKTVSSSCSACSPWGRQIGVRAVTGRGLQETLCTQRCWLRLRQQRRPRVGRSGRHKC